MAQLQFLELVISFCALVNHGCHVSKASKYLGLSQPAVSMQMKRLEKKLAQKLFQKTGSQLILTAEGERFYISVSGYAKKFSEFETIVSKNIIRPKRGLSLKILGNNSAYHYILPKITKRLFDQYPDLQLTIYFEETPQAMSWLNDATVDIAILPRRSHLNFPEAGIAITISSDIIIESNDQYLTATPLTHLFPKVDYGLVVSKLRPLHPLWNDFKTICDTIARF
jgi:DNA-binding transcriptional LysR family regulator